MLQHIKPKNSTGVKNSMTRIEQIANSHKWSHSVLRVQRLQPDYSDRIQKDSGKTRLAAG